MPGDIDSSCSPEAHHGYWLIADRCISINDTLYLSTITRAGGLMLGAAFAMVWRPIAIMRSPMRDRGRQLDVLAVIGVLGLAFLVWSIHLADPALNILTGSRFDPWLFRGGIFLTGIFTLFVIAAVTHQRAMAGVLLGNPVLSWVGTRSYGLYLYHWPIYQIIRQEAGKTLTLWQFLLAMLVAGAAHRGELPVRRDADPQGRDRPVAARRSPSSVPGRRCPSPSARRARRGRRDGHRLGRRQHRDGPEPVRRHGRVRERARPGRDRRGELDDHHHRRRRRHHRLDRTGRHPRPDREHVAG